MRSSQRSCKWIRLVFVCILIYELSTLSLLQMHLKYSACGKAKSVSGLVLRELVRIGHQSEIHTESRCVCKVAIVRVKSKFNRIKASSNIRCNDTKLCGSQSYRLYDKRRPHHTHRNFLSLSFFWNIHDNVCRCRIIVRNEMQFYKKVAQRPPWFWVLVHYLSFNILQKKKKPHSTVF